MTDRVPFPSVLLPPVSPTISAISGSTDGNSPKIIEYDSTRPTRTRSKASSSRARSTSVSSSRTEKSSTTATTSSKRTSTHRGRVAPIPDPSSQPVLIRNVQGSRKGKEKAVLPLSEPQPIVEVEDDGEDDDMPVFVGQTVAKKLAERFIFRETSSAGSSTSSSESRKKRASPVKRNTNKAESPPKVEGGVSVTIRPRVKKKEEPDKDEVKLDLLPPREPDPVPLWLGKTAILLQLPDCPLCARRWKKNDNGAQRWVCCVLGSLYYGSSS